MFPFLFLGKAFYNQDDFVGLGIFFDTYSNNHGANYVYTNYFFLDIYSPPFEYILHDRLFAE